MLSDWHTYTQTKRTKRDYECRFHQPTDTHTHTDETNSFTSTADVRGKNLRMRILLLVFAFIFHANVVKDTRSLLQLRPLKNRQLSTGISFYWVILLQRNCTQWQNICFLTAITAQLFGEIFSWFLNLLVFELKWFLYENRLTTVTNKIHVIIST